MPRPSAGAQTSPQWLTNKLLTGVDTYESEAECYKAHMALEFRILGPLEVGRDGRAVALGGRRERMLLAILLVHAREVISTDRIFDELYGERVPATASSSIQNAVSRLRRALGVEVIETRAPGYALTVAPDDLDSLRFERLL